MKMTVSRTVLGAMYLFLFANTALAVPQRIISASFFEPAPVFPQSGPMLDTAIAGVPNFFHGGPADVRVPHWNQLQGPFGLEQDLFDSQGFMSTVDARWIATNVSSNDYQNPVINGDSMMMNGHLFSSTLGFTGLATVTVEDLNASFEVAAGYEVWVYADAENAPGFGQTQSLFVDDGIHAAMALTMTDTVPDVPLRQFDLTQDYDEGTTDGLGVWARFTGLTGTSFTIEARSITPGGPAFINGFQIIGFFPIPEPGTLSMACLGILAVLGMPRRR
jgi:hypothetical protein